MQGSYRLLGPSRGLVETFVAAPGPAGWRYVGRVHPEGSEDETYLIDHVVDAHWRLVQFRLLRGDGRQVVIRPGPEGPLAEGDPGEVGDLSGCTSVWSPSPSALLVLGRRHPEGGEERAVEVTEALGLEAVSVELRPGRRLRAATYWGPARRLDLRVGGRRVRAVTTPELPLRAGGWFELLP